MSLYYEAECFLSTPAYHSGSLKNRIFSTNSLKTSPTQIFALVSQTSKWSSILKEVVEKSQLLLHERKLSPSLSILLVHDLLLAKKGIAAPTAHPLRLATERHKARLHAEFTKLRIRKGFASLDGLRIYVNQTAKEREYFPQDTLVEVRQRAHPRWVRINTLKTSLEEQLATTFADYRAVDSIDEILNAGLKSSTERVVHVDKHIPNLVALAPFAEVSVLPAYRQGLIILQDKASCFPAYLLDPVPQDGDYLDACAAPGNKTTHLTAVLHPRGSHREQPRIWACERDSTRAMALQKMITIAGANDHVTIEAGQDFLKTNPMIDPWRNISALLLDPSCSGSGIIGRDELLPFNLPSRESSATQPLRSKKRKRQNLAVLESVNSTKTNKVENLDSEHEDNDEQSEARLAALSRFQTKLLLHAMTFPSAKKISYSTCSIHVVENEAVVNSVLQSEVAKLAGWRLLLREEQVAGMKDWPIRGQADPFRALTHGDGTLAEQLAEACIRCNMGTQEGTQGFFVAAFTRDAITSISHEDEWEGFD